MSDWGMGPCGPEGPLEAGAGQVPEGRVTGAQITKGAMDHSAIALKCPWGRTGLLLYLSRLLPGVHTDPAACGPGPGLGTPVPKCVLWGWGSGERGQGVSRLGA